MKKIKDKERYLLYARGDNSSSHPERIAEQMYLGKAMGILRSGKMLSFVGWRRYFFNKIVVLLVPVVSKIIKPLYNFCKKTLKR